MLASPSLSHFRLASICDSFMSAAGHVPFSSCDCHPLMSPAGYCSQFIHGHPSLSLMRKNVIPVVMANPDHLTAPCLLAMSSSSCKMTYKLFLNLSYCMYNCYKCYSFITHPNTLKSNKLLWLCESHIS